MNLLPSTAPNPQQTQTQNENQHHPHHQQTQMQQNTAPNLSTNGNPMQNEQINNNDHEATLDWFGNEENNSLHANHGPDDEFINNLAMFPMVCVYAKNHITSYILYFSV